MSQLEVTPQLVKHIANLARLDLQDHEVVEYQGHMAKVLKHFEELNAINTDVVEPFYSPVREDLDRYDSLKVGRDDVIGPSLPTDLILKNAPQSELNQFKVEAVIEES